MIGEVTGLTVRSRNVGAQFGAGLKSIVGGELEVGTGYQELVAYGTAVKVTKL